MSILKGNLRNNFFESKLKESFKQNQLLVKRTSNFKKLDEVQTLKPCIYVAGGETGIGKSTFIQQIAEQMLDNNPHECLIYVTYELTEEDVYYKSLTRCIYQSNPQKAIKESQLQNHADDPVLLDAATQLGARSPLMFVMEFPGEKEQLFEQLYKAVAEFKEIDPLIYSPIVVLDYIQDVPHKDTIPAKTNIDHILHMMKEFQHKTNSTVFVISSINRQSYDLPAKNNNTPFKESGNIEYGAAVNWIFKYEKVDDEHGTFILTCTKSRKGLKDYTLYFDYYHQYDTFVECDKSPNKNHQVWR